MIPADFRSFDGDIVKNIPMIPFSDLLMLSKEELQERYSIKGNVFIIGVRAATKPDNGARTPLGPEKNAMGVSEDLEQGLLLHAVPRPTALGERATGSLS